MAFVVRIGKTLRTHWKKSIFGFFAVTYGIKYAHDRYEENLLRRLYCAEAKKYGDEKIALSERPRRVTVFLNPAAHGGKATKLFEKNAAPILYLAGIEVNVVKTEYDGQVKKFLGVLEKDDTDAIVVAGGDGAVLETVTGIMRKEDKNLNGIPVGVIPLGYTNTFARIFYGPDKETVRIIADAAMAVVKEVTKKVDVLKIDGGEGKTTFALCGMEIGAFRDAEERKKKYWYFGPLKSRWTYLWTVVKNWPPAFKVDISYVEATEDNMRLPEPAVPHSPKNWNFFNFLFRRKQQTTIEEVSKEPEEESEEEEKIMYSTSTVELTLLSPNMLSEQTVPGIEVGIGPVSPTRNEFISEGWQRINKKELAYGTDSNEKLLVKSVSIVLDENNESSPKWYSIDGEAFEAIPVKVSLLRKQLNFFTSVFEPITS